MLSPKGGKDTASLFAISTFEGVPVNKRGWLLPLDRLVEKFAMKLKRREIQGSVEIATQTAETLRTIISKEKGLNVKELIDVIRHVGKILTEARPTELVIGNIVRRVLYVIRHECAVQKKKLYAAEQEEDGSLDENQSVDFSIKLMEDHNPVDLKLPVNEMKADIMEEINQLIDEVRSSDVQIAEHAITHIHQKEVILVYGMSRTIVAFLKEAAKLRAFEVFIAESAPRFWGQKMAVMLADLKCDRGDTKSQCQQCGSNVKCVDCGAANGKGGLKENLRVTVITDSAVFAVMGHVSKVIIGTQAVLANGGLLAHTGASNICWAAKYHSVPVVVLTGLHKLCPLYAFDQDTFNEQSAPSEVMLFDEDYEGKVEVENPAFDYVPPDLVSLFITNFAAHMPSYMVRLLSEYYNGEDYTL